MDKEQETGSVSCYFCYFTSRLRTEVEITVYHQKKIVPCPLLLPDCSPIEHVWDRLQSQICTRNYQSQNLDKLANAVNEE